MPEKKLTTLLEILNYSSEYLKQNAIDNPRLNAELMLADIMKCNRLNLYLDFEKPLNEEEKEKLKSYLKRRAKREPLQYILGKSNFFGYEIKVNSNVLIPRQDSEIAVEAMLSLINESGKKEVNVMEIGTGSGCIAVALISELKKRGVECIYTGIEISEAAVGIAKENLELNNIKNYKIIRADFLEDVFIVEDVFDYIVSNPPYVPFDEYKTLEPEVNNFEPDFAVTDFEDGIKFYSKIFDLYKKISADWILEIAWNAKDKLEKLMATKGIEKYTFIKDYNNNYRVLKLQK